MQLNESQKKQFLHWLKAKRKDSEICPVCHQKNWGLSDSVSELRNFAGGKLAVGGTIIPLLCAVCTNCGYTRLFNAITIGIVEPPRTE